MKPDLWDTPTVYGTDFDKSRYGIGPSIGFRLLGFHLVNGYNFWLEIKN
jgi:hypothetical protein